MYKKFHNNFIYWDGQYVDVGEILLGDTYYTSGGLMVFKQGNNVIPKNCLVKITGVEVLSVLENGNLLTIENGVVLHVRGLKKGFVDGQSLTIANPLFYNGTYQYVTAIGAKSTVKSYSVCEFPNRSDFNNLINTGVKLISYTKKTNGKTRKHPIY